MARVMEAVELVTTLPDWSSTVTAGWVVQAAPSAPPPGWALKTSWEAGPKVMVKLGAGRRGQPGGRRGQGVGVPALPVISQPAKVATPLVAASGLPLVQARVARRAVGPDGEGDRVGRGGDGVAAGVLDGDDRLGGPGGAVGPAAGLAP